jgi:hypothetical protein
MQVLLDDQPLSMDPPTLAAAVRGAQQIARARGRIIVEASADGNLISDDLLANPSDEPVRIATLSIRSAEPRALVSFTLADAADALSHVAEDHDRVGREIQAGRTQDALGKLGDSIATWQAVCDILNKSASLLKIDLDSIDVGDGDSTPLSARFKIMLERLASIKTALETQDFSALSDVLLYDMAPLARQWSATLGAIAGRVRDGRLGSDSSPV